MTQEGLTEDDIAGIPGGALPTSLALIITAEQVTALTNGTVDFKSLTDGLPFALVSLKDLSNLSTSLGQLNYMLGESVINPLREEFFGANYVSMYYNGPCLGAMFEMVYYNA